VSARTSSDAWAVGMSFRPEKPEVALFLHWNGTPWSVR
jgi:hypothetical protein